MIRCLAILVFTCACFLSRAQVNIITTIAGTGTAGYSGDGGPAISAELNRPCAICFDNTNNLYFADAFNHRVRKINLTTGVISNIAGNGSGGFSGDGNLATDAQLYVPEGVCLDANGNLYISDGLNHRIRKVSLSTGLISTVAGIGTAGSAGDGGLAINAELNITCGIYTHSQQLFVCDYNTKKLRRVDLSTGIITAVAGTGVNGYSGDNGPAINSLLNGVIDVHCNSTGNLFIADQWNGVVRKIDISTGVITTVAGKGSLGYSGDGGPATNAEMNEPCGVFIDKDDNLFIADYRNGAIRKVDGISGKITTVAGGGPGYSGDGGPATDAKLKCLDVWVDQHNNIYIADYVNDRIRKVNNAVVVNGIDKGIESKLYPNPTRGVFTIQTPVNFTLASVYNIGGVKVYERTCTTANTEIDITTQPPGVYMVYVQCGEKMYVSKIVKE